MQHVVVAVVVCLVIQLKNVYKKERGDSVSVFSLIDECDTSRDDASFVFKYI